LGSRANHVAYNTRGRQKVEVRSEISKRLQRVWDEQKVVTLYTRCYLVPVAAHNKGLYTRALGCDNTVNRYGTANGDAMNRPDYEVQNGIIRRNFQLYDAMVACRAYRAQNPTDGRWKLYFAAQNMWRTLARATQEPYDWWHR
jgi:hypothetical protein